MAIMEEIKQLTKVANTKFHNFKVKDVLKFYSKREDVEIVTDTKGCYYTIEEVLKKLSTEYSIAMPIEIFQEFLLFPLTGNETDLRPYSSLTLDILTDNMEELLAKAVLKMGDNQKLLINKEPIDNHLIVTAFLAIEYCLSLKKYRITVKNLGKIIIITLDNFSPIVIKTTYIDTFLEVIQGLHEDLQLEVYVNLAKLLRRNSPEIRNYIEKSKSGSVNDIIKGF